MARIVFVVGLVHEPGSSGGCLEHLNGAEYLIVGIAGERVDDLRHRPDHVATDMWSSNALARCPTEEPWVQFAPYKLPCSGVNCRVQRALEVRKTEQARHIGVIHQYVAAVTVDFISPNRSSRGRDERMLAQRRFDL